MEEEGRFRGAFVEGAEEERKRKIIFTTTLSLLRDPSGAAADSPRPTLAAAAEGAPRWRRQEQPLLLPLLLLPLPLLLPHFHHLRLHRLGPRQAPPRAPRRSNPDG